MTENKLREYPTVRKWLGSIRGSTGKGYLWHLEAFMDWAKVNSPKFGSMSPDELVEYALDATPRQINELLDLKKEYLLSMEGRLNHKLNANKSITSFFMHNRVELPADKTLNLSGNTPKIEGSLTPEDVKRVVLSSNVVYQAVFLVMLGSGMGQAELVTWSNEGFKELKTQLDAKAELVRVSLHGRKGDRNNYNYTTFIGGDALDALKRYMAERDPQPGAIFLNTHHEPLTQVAVYQTWTHKLRRLGLLPDGKGWTGRNPHGLRDVYRTLWRRSGVEVAYAEYFMGHREAFDRFGYDKTGADVDELRKQYLKALPYLNIITGARPFKLYTEDDVENKLNERIKQLEEEKRASELRQSVEMDRVKAEMRAESESTYKKLEERIAEMDSKIKAREYADDYDFLVAHIFEDWAQTALKQLGTSQDMIEALVKGAEWKLTHGG